MVKSVYYTLYNTWMDFIEDTRREVLDTGFVTVVGLPIDAPQNSLIRLASSLGELSLSDVSAPDKDNPDVHKIQARAEPLRDSRGVILSTTSESFPCHTDDYFEWHPSDIVILQCVRPASTGGDSVVARLNDILGVLGSETVNNLMLPVFPSPLGPVPILELNDGSYAIRYNRIQMERAAEKSGAVLTPKDLAALNQLDDAIAQTQQWLSLSAGDCLVLNNKTVVHGRTAFPPDSDRLLRRVKVYL